MCNFISGISDGRGHLDVFTPEQRIAGVTMPDGGKCNYDSHTSIACYYHRNEDAFNKHEWNPYNNVLKLDQQNTADDSAAVLAAFNAIDWTPVAGDYMGARAFIAGLKNTPWYQNCGELPDGVRMFDTRGAASGAAWDVEWGAARDAASGAAMGAALGAAMGAAWDAASGAAMDAASGAAMGAAWGAARDAASGAARDAAMGAARDAAMGAAWGAARDAAWDAAMDAAWDAALYVCIKYVCCDLKIAQKHIDYIVRRWAVWQAGYGVLCDVDGIFYCYKKP